MGLQAHECRGRLVGSPLDGGTLQAEDAKAAAVFVGMETGLGKEGPATLGDHITLSLVGQFKQRLNVFNSDPRVVQFIRGGESGQSQRNFEEQTDEECSNSKRPFMTLSVSHEEVCR